MNKSTVSQVLLWVFGGWLAFYAISLVIASVLGNGSSMGLALPFYLSRYQSSQQAFWVDRLNSHLTWYDKLLIVGVIPISDFENLDEIVANYRQYQEENPQRSEQYQSVLQELEFQMAKSEACEYKGELGHWRASVPTRSYLGLYYKNFLVSCNNVEFSTNEGFGRNFARQ
jgi:hypothetical protein